MFRINEAMKAYLHDPVRILHLSTKIDFSKCRAWIVTIVAVLVICPSIGMAKVCVPYGYGGAYAPGAPTWWQGHTTSGWGRFNTWVDDPRWSGSNSITYGDGGTPELQFRSLYYPQHNPKYIYLSWWYKAALVSPATQNRIWVGLSSATNQPAILVDVDLTANTAVASSSSAASINVKYYNSDGSVSYSFPTRPAWTDDVRVWVDQVTDQTTLNPPLADNTSESGNWAVHMRVPIGVELGDAGHSVVLSPTFSMWYELLQGTPGMPVIAYVWPRASCLTTPNKCATGFANNPTLPATSTWDSVELGGGGCGGINIEASDITVTNTGVSSDGSTISTTATPNIFTATPTNLSTDAGGSNKAIDVGKLHARFRIANWGIQPDSANWNTVRGLGDVQQSGGGTIAYGSKWSITRNWTPDITLPDEKDFFTCDPNGSDPAKKPCHQCVQVELSGPSDLEFLKSSAFQNMRVVQNSVFSESAEVSTVGLPPASTPKRDVYLYVQTNNMPASVAGDKKPPRSTKPPVITPEYARMVEKGRISHHSTDIEENDDTQENPPPDSDLQADRGRSVLEQRFDAEPTYIVRGYYDTGLKINIDGKEHPVLESMVAFGYFSQHEGALYGWKHKLEGAEKIGKDFYRLRVPNNGTEKITNTVETLEQPPIVDGVHLAWWLWVVLIILGILLILFIFRHKLKSV
ncbi:MAG: hypothetical protein ACXWT1_04520 [Methylobacter sp.]